MPFRAREGHIAYRDDQFLADAALAYALTAALDAAPGDGELTGVIRRDYTDAAPLNLYLLGAVIWSAESGARGIRFHLLDSRQRAMDADGPGAGGRDGPQFPALCGLSCAALGIRPGPKRHRQPAAAAGWPRRQRRSDRLGPRARQHNGCTRAQQNAGR